MMAEHAHDAQCETGDRCADCERSEGPGDSRNHPTDCDCGDCLLPVINDEGRVFHVRIVQRGDRYGRDDCIVYDESDKFFGDGQPMVEWYDATYVDKFGPRGQFVSRYTLDVLDGTSEWSRGDDLTQTGLNLDGGVPVWHVSGDNVRDALAFARSKVAERQTLREEQK